MEKSRVLIVGGSGYIGRRLVKASLALGHPTYILQRREIGLDIEKIQILLSFKQQGARLIEASFSDHRSLVDAVKLVDVVVCAASGVHHRSHSILMQLKLVDAIKEAGNIKRFVPSEFGTDPARMAHALSPSRNTFDEMMAVRKAIENAGIPTPTSPPTASPDTASEASASSQSSYQQGIASIGMGMAALKELLPFMVLSDGEA